MDSLFKDQWDLRVHKLDFIQILKSQEIVILNRQTVHMSNREWEVAAETES